MAQFSARAEDEGVRCYWRVPNGVIVLESEECVSFGPGIASPKVEFGFGVDVGIAASAAAVAAGLAASGSCLALAFGSAQDGEFSTRSFRSVEVMGMS